MLTKLDKQNVGLFDKLFAYSVVSFSCLSEKVETVLKVEGDKT